MVVGKANSNDHVEFNSNIDKDQVEAFNDGPGVVLVHILTSLRHLPSAMHSVLLVMALTWMRVSLGAGPWDALFGGGNIPAFALASIFSLTTCIVAIAKLPRL